MTIVTNYFVLHFVVFELVVCSVLFQVCEDLSQWTVLLRSSTVCAPRIDNIFFIIEATEHKVGSPSHRPSNKKVSNVLS